MPEHLLPKVPPPEHPRLLDLYAAAEYLGVSPRWLRRQWSERRLAGYKLGHLVRFAHEDLDALAASGRVEAVR